MATGGYDGSIRIDTKIDSKGFNAGIKNIMGAVQGVAAAIGIAFGIKAIVDFGKTAVNAASTMSSALKGLQFLLNAQGRSFADAKKFINDYIADGLVPASNAIEAYKNLVSRGYDDSQIRTILKVMKDSAVYNRQASYTVGNAIQTASEGLKNENSILTDNVGITKNVAKMWEDYAKSIGTTTNNLTLAQKRQAEVNGFLEEARYFQGAAASYADTYSGKVASLTTVLTNFKVAVGNTVIPVLAQIIPVASMVLGQLTEVFNGFSMLTQAFFGVDASATMAAQEATDAQSDLADETERANKAAKGSLAAFDKLNVLQDKQKTDEKQKSPIAPFTPQDELVPSSVLDKVREFKDQVKALLEPLREPFERLKQSAIELGGSIWEGLKWVFANILVPLGIWLVTQAAPVFLDLLSAGLNVVNAVIIALRPSALWLWDNFLKPLAEWTGQAFIDSIKWITDRLNDLADWIHTNPDDFARIIGRALEFLFGPIGELIAHFDEWKKQAIDAWNAVSNAFSVAGNWFNQNVVIPIANWFKSAWEDIKSSGQNAWLILQGIWFMAGVWFRANVSDPIRSAFNSVFDWIGSAWENAFGGVYDFTKGTVNSVIGLINGMVQAVTDGINAVVSGLNSINFNIPDWVPVFGGQGWGLNLGYVNAPQIPYLANGAVIPANAPFAAVLGDQRNGVNVEAPADLIRQIVREEMGSQQVNVKVDFEGSLASFVRELHPLIQSESKRIGNNLIVGGATI